MTSVDGRNGYPMVGQLSTDKYYITIEKLSSCSKLSGRITHSDNLLGARTIRLSVWEMEEFDKDMPKSDRESGRSVYRLNGFR